MNIGKELENAEVKQLLSEIELGRARLGVPKDDVEKILEAVCSIYEEQSKKSESQTVDMSNYVPVSEYEVVKAKLTEAIADQKKIEDERHAITEVLIDSRSRAKKILDEATLESVNIIQRAKDEAEQLRSQANAVKDETLAEAESERSKILLEASKRIQEAEDSAESIVQEANDEKSLIIRKAQEEANSVVEIARLKLHEAEQTKAAIIEKANQKAEGIVSNSRQEKERNERRLSEIQKNIDDKKAEYSRYIGKVEENFGYMHESLVDFKKDLDLMFVVDEKE